MRSGRVNIHGAGWSGLVCGYLLQLLGYDVNIYEKEAFLGGHARSIKVQGVTVEAHGIHVFHCNEEWMWRFVSSFTQFRWYCHRALTQTDYGMFNWPLTMESIERHPLRSQILAERADLPVVPVGDNFEEWCLSMFGKTLYETFIKGYSEKMWGDVTRLDVSFAPKRLEFREDNNPQYFKDRYQGVPVDGYNAIYAGLAERLTIHSKTRGTLDDSVLTIVTAPPDELLEYTFGKLPYRSLKFRFETFDRPVGQNMLKTPQVNYPTMAVPHTRQTEARQYTKQDIAKTVVVTETPGGNGLYYPMPTAEAKALHLRYKEALEGMGVVLAGRLGNYKYLNMNEVIDDAFATVSRITGVPLERLIKMAQLDRAPYQLPVL